ncbi:MAG: hypothetical protein E6R04_08005 [Spirochaetes bacterium]|nr:MAG: hypothetical protein E6R04_08005 [Spirochaetota bacterium]
MRVVDFSDGFTSASAPTALPLGAPDGTVSAPGISFTSDPDCGFYRIGANNIGLSLNGTKVIDFATTVTTFSLTTAGSAVGTAAVVFLGGIGVAKLSYFGGGIITSALTGGNDSVLNQTTDAVTVATSMRLTHNPLYTGSSRTNTAQIVLNRTSTVDGDYDGTIELKTRATGSSLTTGLTVNKDQSLSLGGTANTGHAAAYNIINGTTKVRTAALIFGASGATNNDYPYIGYGTRSTSSGATWNYDLADRASIIYFNAGGITLKTNNTVGVAGNAITFIDALTLSAAGLVTVGASAGTQTHVINGQVSQTFPTAGTQARHSLTHSDTANAASDASMRIISGGSSGGDCQTHYIISGVRDWISGVDNSDSDKFKIACSSAMGTSSTDYFSIDTGGLITLGAASGTSTHIVNGASLRLNYATAGSSAILQARHSDNTSGNSHCHLYLETGGGSAGDPKVSYFVGGGQDWAHGIDNNDSDCFVLSNSGNLGTNNAIRVGTDLIVGMPNGFKTKVSTANTANPPTNAELISAFGAAATVGSGFIGLLDDNNGHTNEYLVWSDGTKYWILTGTAAA